MILTRLAGKCKAKIKNKGIMKKKVAVYANGCAYEYAGTLLDGIEEAAKACCGYLRKGYGYI